MKKLLAILCALCLAFSLAACGGSQDQEIDTAVSKVCSSAKVEGEEVEGKLKEAFTKLQADGYIDLDVTGSLLSYIAAGSQNLGLDIDWYAITKAALDLGEGDKEKSLDIMGAATGYIFIFDRSVEAAMAELQVDARKKGMEPFDYAKWVTEDFERWECEKSDQQSNKGKQSSANKASEKSDPNGAITTGQKNALKSAGSYLSFSAFSYNGLIGQLEYEGYSTEEATYAADHCGADWNEQALKSAKNYLDVSAFSYSGLIGQLEYEQYTTEQATYGADNCGADWNEQAVKSAKSYLEISSFSRDGLISQLEYEGFTREQAVYGAQENGY